MRFILLVVSACIAPLTAVCQARPAAVCPSALAGGWRGESPLGVFRAGLALERRPDGSFRARIAFSDTTESIDVWRSGDRIGFQSVTRDVAYRGRLESDGSGVTGFVSWGDNLMQLTLAANGQGGWAAEWTGAPIGADRAVLDLYFDETDDGAAGGYFFFRDQRLPGLWGEPVRCDADGTIHLSERTTGMQLTGRLATDSLHWTVRALGTGRLVMSRIPDGASEGPPDAPLLPPSPAEALPYRGAAPPDLADGWQTARPDRSGLDRDRLAAMVAAIRDGEWNFTHSVLVARRGRLVFEEYFHGFDAATWHDLRSASKTIASVLAGVADQQGVLPDLSTPVVAVLPPRRYANPDPRKFRIRLRDLLTMSSGLDADDSRGNSVAAEGNYQSQDRQPDWIGLAMDAPMIAEPGAQPLYGGANPMILGGVLDHLLGGETAEYAHERLFAPLGIHGYRWKLTPTGTPYQGGGIYMRPRDFARIGQLFLDRGQWQGQQIVSPEWVTASWADYGRLAPLVRNGHRYGFLWWHHAYEVNGRRIETREARGNGGQYLVVVPSLDAVIVITSGNYRTGGTRRPEALIAEHILPAFVD